MKHIIQRATQTTLVAFALSLPNTAHAWYGENVEGKDGRVDLMMMDIRYPYWPESIYNACWNTRLLTEDNKAKFYFYGGWSMSVASLPDTHKPNLDPEVQDAHRPKSVWSFWGKSEDGTPVEMVAASEYTFPLKYVGEGASGALPADANRRWDMIERGKWYTQLLRTWWPVTEEGETPDHAFVGRWFKDVERKQWHLYGIARIPVAVVGFNGNAQFLEDFGNGGRSVVAQDRRLGYYRKDGEWQSSDTVTIHAKKGYQGFVTQLKEDGTVLGIEQGNLKLLPFQLEGEPLEAGKTHELSVKQAPKPNLDQPAVEGFNASFDGQAVLVSWEIPASSAPQFSYQVEVLASPDGEPLAVLEQRDPIARMAVVPTQVDRPTVRLTITDVFDQEVVTLAQATAAPAPAAPKKVEQAEPGLTYRLYAIKGQPADEEDGDNPGAGLFREPLARLTEGNLIRQGYSQGHDETLADGRDRNFGFRLNGLLRVPETGTYLIHARVADGFRMNLAGQACFHNDGIRGPAAQSVALRLEKGDHPVEIETFFVNRFNPSFALEWESATMARRPISGSDFFHAGAANVPAVELTIHDGDTITPEIRVNLDPRGTRVDAVRVFLSGMEIAHVTEFEDSSLKIRQLLPSGEFDLNARIYYDGDSTIDSVHQTLVVPAGEPITGWNTIVVGEAGAHFNAQETRPGVYEFVGEGEFRFTRDVEGDFTLTAKIDSHLGPQGEKVNKASMIGITAGHIRGRWRNTNLFHTGKLGLRASADFSDMAANHMSRQTFPIEHRWLRLVRQGGAIAMWTSADGKRWEFGSVYSGSMHSAALPPKLEAGIMIRVLPQDSQAFFSATVSHVSLVPGVAPELAVPTPPTAEGTANADWLGLASAPSDPAVVALRSDTKGIVLSRDGGKSWETANGNLIGEANQVRSLAIDPTNPAVIWRASRAGLFKTNDSGGTWEKLGFPGNFDATGPTGLCGEIIAIHPRNPQIVVLGSESKGLFRSADGGASWKEISPGGQRFTFVGFHPKDLVGDAAAPLVATTCADRWMELLGRGAPGTRTSAQVSRCYHSIDDGATIRKGTVDHLDFGFFNAALGAHKGMRILYGTSHGLAYTVSYGNEIYLLTSWEPTERLRPMSAVGARVLGVLATPINPENPARLTHCHNPRDLGGRWLKLRAPEQPAAWLKFAPADLREKGDANHWWALRADGLFALDLKSGATTKMTPSILLGTSN